MKLFDPLTHMCSQSFQTTFQEEVIYSGLAVRMFESYIGIGFGKRCTGNLPLFGGLVANEKVPFDCLWIVRNSSRDKKLPAYLGNIYVGGRKKI